MKHAAVVATALMMLATLGTTGAGAAADAIVPGQDDWFLVR
jgi:hypothetical protein